MYKGTTPTITLNIKTQLDFNDIKQVWFTIASAPDLKITKDIRDVVIGDNSISVTLTQDETLSLPTGIVEVQARILMNNDTAFATPAMKLMVNRILEGGVISG